MDDYPGSIKEAVHALNKLGHAFIAASAALSKALEDPQVQALMKAAAEQDALEPALPENLRYENFTVTVFLDNAGIKPELGNPFLLAYVRGKLLARHPEWDIRDLTVTKIDHATGEGPMTINVIASGIAGYLLISEADTERYNGH